MSTTSNEVKILIVEDEQIIAQDIKSCLLTMGYDVPAIASSGEDALRYIGDVNPDLVLMDIKLKGDMSGIEVTAQVGALFNVPVVYLTANADTATVEKVKKTEPYGFIQKPIEPDVLRAVIEMALYKYGAEREHKERERWLDATLQSIGDAVIATDKKGNITVLNPVAETLTGWTQAECKGRPLTEIFNIINAKTRTRVPNPVETVLESGKQADLDNHTVLIDRKGGEHQIADSASPIHDDKGEVVGVVLVFRDVTDEYQMREEIESAFSLLEVILESIHDGILVIDNNGNVLKTNKRFSELWRIPDKLLANGNNKELLLYVRDELKDPEQFAVRIEEIHDNPEQENLEILEFKDGRFVERFTRPMMIDGRVYAWVHSYRNITERRKTAEDLENQSQVLNAIFDNAPYMLVLVNEEGRVEKINHKGAAFSGSEPDELKGLLGGEVFRCLNSFDGEGCGRNKVCTDCPVRTRVDSTFQTGESRTEEEGRMTFSINNEAVTLDLLISTAQVDVTGQKMVLLSIVNNTERKQAEKMLRESEERLYLALEGADLGLWDHDYTTGIIIRNEGWAKMLGYSMAEIASNLQFWENIIHPDDRDRVLEEMEIIEKGETWCFREEYRVRTKNGGWKWILDWGKITERDSDGRPLRAVGTHMDITDRKLAEEKIRINLREKEVLLQEINHRVKNNMTVISSLLSLQSRKIHDRQALNALEDSRNRIKTMSLIHEKLYKSENFAEVEFATYLEDLCSHLFETYNVDSEKIRLRLDIGDTILDVAQSIPCGLIINELISNALKHGFPDGISGEVYIEMKQEMDECFLKVGNNGVRFPETVDIENSESMGLRMVKLFSEQLEGSVDINRENGALFTIRFPL